MAVEHQDIPQWPKRLQVWGANRRMMGTTIELDEGLYDRLDSHAEEGETVEEFIEELVNMYETEGTFIQEGYSE